MNQDNDQQKAAVDPQVSDQYESLAGEKTPVHLDRAVLREATRAVRADNRKGSFGAWFRPVAFMATVGLSLAIILDLSDTGIFKPVADISVESAPAIQTAPKSTADSAGRNSSQPTLSDIKRQEKLAPTADAPDQGKDNAGVTTPPAAASESLQANPRQLQKTRLDAVRAVAPPPAEPVEDQAYRSNAITVEAGIAEQRVQKVERAIDANLQSRPGTADQFTAPQAAIATESYVLATPAACSNEQKSDVEEWWKCIQSLRQSGLAEVADQELVNFREAFPDFAPPE